MSTPRPYAARTTVPTAQTKQEIEALLVKHGAEKFGIGWAPDAALLTFAIAGRQIRMFAPITTSMKEAEQQRRWRALLLVLRAKLIAVQDEISTIEREFHADIVMPNGQTVYEWSQPQIEAMYKSGEMPPLLPGLEAKKLPPYGL